MVKYFLLFSLLILNTTVFSQNTDPVTVAQQQLDAYNLQDLNAFVNVFADSAEVFYNIDDTVPSMVGKGQIRARYGAMFEQYPQNKSTLIGRMVQGNFVFDHEWINTGEREFKIVAIYEIEDGLIQRAWFVR